MPLDFELPPPLTLDQSGEPSPKQDAGVSGSVKKGQCLYTLYDFWQWVGKLTVDRVAGQPWSEAEHLQFLAGLKKLGKGNFLPITYTDGLLQRGVYPSGKVFAATGLPVNFDLQATGEASAGTSSTALGPQHRWLRTPRNTSSDFMVTASGRVDSAR